MTPSAFDLQRAADVLNEGSKVAMLVGAGSLGAEAELTETADILGAGVAKALLGKASLPDDLPYVTGSIGLLGTRPSWELMQDCDSLLMVGTNFPYGEFLPAEGKAKAVQIDIEGRHLGLRYPTTVEPGGRLGGHAPRPDPHARPQDRSEMAREGGEVRRRLVEPDGEADPTEPTPSIRRRSSGT